MIDRWFLKFQFIDKRVIYSIKSIHFSKSFIIQTVFNHSDNTMNYNKGVCFLSRDDRLNKKKKNNTSWCHRFEHIELWNFETIINNESRRNKKKHDRIRLSFSNYALKHAQKKCKAIQSTYTIRAFFLYLFLSLVTYANDI